MEVVKPDVSLVTVSDLCLELISHYLDYYDVSALYLTGNRALRSKIERSIVEIDVQIPWLGTYPISAFKLPRLRSMVVKPLGIGMKHLAYPTYYVINDQLVPVDGHKHLELLEIWGTLAFSVLLPNDDQPRLAELLPNLRTLRLAGDGYFQTACFENVPQTLTELSLRPTWNHHYHLLSAISLPPEVLNHLPRSLETLVIATSTLTLDPVEKNDFHVLVFPPALTHLEFACEFVEATLEGVPSMIQTLKIEHKNHRGQDILKVSALKKFTFLTSFSLESPRSSQLLIDFDEPFPSSLTSISLPKTVETVPENPISNYNAILPSSLTSFHGAKDWDAHIDWFTMFPLLKSISLTQVAFEKTAPKKMPPLTSLFRRSSLGLPTDYIKVLPNTLVSLTGLVSNTEVWLGSVAQLTHLESLELASLSGTLPSKGFWDVMHGRLKRCKVFMACFESIDDLCGDWKRLDDLELWIDDALLMPALKEDVKRCSGGQKAFCYPRTLTSLRGNTSVLTEFFLGSLKHLTQLETLNLSIAGTDCSQSVESALNFLADSVTSINLHIKCDIPPSALWHLPKRLISLGIATPFNEAPWTLSHFQTLPKTLSRLELSPNHDETQLLINGSSYGIRKAQALAETDRQQIYDPSAKYDL